MKESYWGYWLMLLGIFVIVIMLLIQNLTSSNTQDYYLVKEITEAAMIDAVDYGYYREYGEVRIIKEKFVESFVRRFAETADLTSTYQISFSEIYEAPPKVSVEVKSQSSTFNIFGDTSTFDIVNRIDEILEMDVTNSVASAGTNRTASVEEVSGVNSPKKPGGTTNVVPGSASSYDTGTTTATNEAGAASCVAFNANFNVADSDKDKVKDVSFPSFTCGKFTNQTDKSCHILFPRIITKAGYQAIGWKGPDGRVYSEGQEITISANTNYTAVVTPIKNYVGAGV